MRYRIVLACAALSSFALAQHVWVVAPTLAPGVDAVQIQAAIDLASDGDIVLVESGSYAPFRVVGKSLGICADNGADVAITSALRMVELSDIGAAQVVSLHGLRIDGSSPTVSGVPLSASAPLGRVWVEQCTLIGGHDQGAASLLTAQAGAYFELAAPAVVVRSSVSGGDGAATATQPGGNGGVGALATNARLLLYGSVFRGGAGGANTAFPYAPGGDSALAVSFANVFASGCAFDGGAGGAWPCAGGAGGSGLELVEWSHVRVVATTVNGGSGGVPTQAGCGVSGADGADVQITPFGQSFAAAPGIHRALDVASPLREGETADITVHGNAGEHAWLLISANADDVEVPGFTAPLALALPARVVALGALSASGSAHAAFVVQDLGAGVEGTRAFVQAVFAETSGALAPGEPRCVTLLDAGL